ncbi:TOMM system kinase/cyclase fusion protein [Pseudoalteromonas sp. MMG012]|uniref:TOMM system kinase/cyclase fusion protein n=1 Tax=Pseudoalteromonas sp. MMG012 TaxID=2822686 RepID=UPI001B3A4FC9|nr:TOMM system kinase/cyclase fusion protein [Pseudoalteromonas sp. MMG012]MBQ4849535.1 TOMM system kinase/cyclase fusion protein [Pseudoalteromonas sp. MMG012]
MATLTTDLDIKTTFRSDYYKLLNKIGEGGFGLVYKAKQVSTGQIVAIKFLSLPHELVQDKRRRYIERFHREVDLIGRLNHPNIVQLIDKGQQQDSLLYAVYEYIDGQSLRDKLINSGPFEPSDAAHIMASVLDALAHAHDKGVIHRDIKPANIMLYRVGANTHVKVLDFGIGALRHEARQLDYKSITLTQETLGTPSYSAPEQLRGEPPIPQTDIYVWGLVFLECLTGQPAISGSSLAAIFHQQLSPSNVPLGLLAGHESANLLRRVLNKKSQERPASTTELYHHFKKLNFSNLVGSLSFQTNRDNRGIVQSNDDDETQYYDARLSYTRLTERKQVSVLCVIISTVQEATIGNEEQDILDTLHADQMQQCIDIAVRYGAYHVGNLGDTLLFYFGYPQVTDNDSRLCSRTALEIASNLHKKNALLKKTQGVTCYAHMGIQVGMMVSLANNMPEGKTAHEAMNLCRQAPPNQILCSENVKHLLDGYLHFDMCNQVNLTHNQNDPIFILHGERQLEAFGFLRGTRKNSIFVGRQPELRTLHTLLTSQLNPDRPRCVHIQGEAGIGKSRLVFELRTQSKALRHLVAQCLPEYRNNALFPIITLLKFKYSLDALTDTQALGVLKQAIQRTFLTQEKQEQGLLILSAWLNLPLPEHNNASSLSPEIQKQRLFDILVHLLCQPSELYHNGAAVVRHLFIFEDMHWADPTSQEFIGYFVSTSVFREGAHSWLTTSRESQPASVDPHLFTQLCVPKLNKEDTTSFITYLFDHQPLASGLLQVLQERTDGIPLFIEELASSLQKQKLVHKINGQFDFVSEDKKALVPMTLRDSLQQKLDQLQSGKDTAQLAAAIGREFDYALLVSASDKDEAQIQNDLQALINTELVFQQRQVDGDNYIFKHALVRDAAYEAMSLQQKEQIHLQVAKSLEKSLEYNADLSMSLIARHFFLAKQYREATEYGLKGVQQQVTYSANVEALEATKEVLDWCQHIKTPTVAMELEIQILGAQIAPVLSLDGYGGDRVAHITQQIPALVKQLNELAPTGNTHLRKLTKDKSDWVLFLNLFYESQREKAGILGREMMADAIAHNDTQRHMMVAMMLAEVYFFDSDIDNALVLHEKAISLWDPERDKNCYRDYGIHPHVQNLAMGGMYYLHSGDISTAAIRLAQAESLITDDLDDISRVFVYLFQAINAIHLNDNQQIKDSMHAYDRQYGKGTSVVHHTVYLSALYAFATDDFELGNLKTNIIRQSEQNISTARWCTFLAKLYMKHHHFDEAIKRFRDSFAIAQRNNTFIWFPYIKTTLAKCLFLKGYHEGVSNPVSHEIKQLLHDSIQLAWQKNSRWSALEALHCLKAIAPELMTSDYNHKLKELTMYMNERGLQNVTYKPDFIY